MAPYIVSLPCKTIPYIVLAAVPCKLQFSFQAVKKAPGVYSGVSRPADGRQRFALDNGGLKAADQAAATDPGGAMAAEGVAGGSVFRDIAAIRPGEPKVRKSLSRPAWMMPSVTVPGGRHGAGWARSPVSAGSA